MEGKPQQKGNVITRNIYVFDKRRSTDSPALVNVYARTDTITDSDDTVEVKLQARLQIGVPGAPKAKCFMAGSDSVLYVGTDVSTTATAIRPAELGISHIQGYGNIKSITADGRGYVSVSYPDLLCYIFDPAGDIVADGGCDYKMADTRNAFTTNAH
jgi:hypothetical protein